MKINPETLSWEAPAKNVDGTPIQYELNYEVGISKNGEYKPLVVIAAQLTENDGEYEAPITQLNLEKGEHTIALRSFAKDNPDRKSQWSGPVSFVLSDEIPQSPLGVRVF